jgi:hypothetical protein
MVRNMQEEVDFSPVLRTAVIDCGVASPVEALYALEAFLQWLSVVPAADDGDHYVMLKGDPDRVWHAAIMNTALYRHICTRYVGRFVDHSPSLGTPRPAWILETVSLLEEYFGDDLHPVFREWRAEAGEQEETHG